MPNKSKKKEFEELVLGMGCYSSTNLTPWSPITEDEAFLLLISLEIHRYSTDRAKIPRSSNWLETILPHSMYGDRRFRQNLRMQKESFGFVLGLIKDDAEFNETQENVPVQLSVGLYSMGTFGNAASVGQIADKFGISEGAVKKYTARVVKSLNNISKNWIRWPDPTERRRIGSQMAHELLPKCIGFVDGSDATFYQAPTDDKDVYWSRKKKYCMQFQIVCDPSKFIRHLYTGYPGSVHDAKVYSSTELFIDEKKFFNSGEFILGDSAYMNCETVIVPFRRCKKGVSAKQKNFNVHLSSHRVYVEHTIGILKGRFQSLQGLRLTVDKQAGHRNVCERINACAVLHNVLMKIDPWVQTDDNFYEDEDEQEDDVLPEIEVQPNIEGARKRDALVEIIAVMKFC